MQSTRMLIDLSPRNDDNGPEWSAAFTSLNWLEVAQGRARTFHTSQPKRNQLEELKDFCELNEEFFFLSVLLWSLIMGFCARHFAGLRT